MTGTIKPYSPGTGASNNLLMAIAAKIELFSACHAEVDDARCRALDPRVVISRIQDSIEVGIHGFDENSEADKALFAKVMAVYESTRKEAEVHVLTEVLTRLRDAYYNADSEVDDVVFDQLESRLSELDPENTFFVKTGAPAHICNAVHAHRMGSQDKAKTVDEVLAWYGKVGPGKLHISTKLDGCSLDLTYAGGVLIRAATRGDGFVGEDVTTQARDFVPVKAGRFTGSVHGEVILPVKAWAALDPKAESNPRAIGAGLLRRSGADRSPLHFYAHAAYAEPGPGPDTESGVFQLLTELGFELPDWDLFDSDEINAMYARAVLVRPNLPYWADGLVLRLDSIADQARLGWSGNHRRGQIALKFKPEPGSTRLVDVVWDVGVTGTVTPTGVFDPVRLGGSTITRASLCNMDEIRRLELGIGDTVIMYKAGDIIPKVLAVSVKANPHRPVPIPDVCPVCEHGLTKDGAYLVCKNAACQGQIVARVERWVTAAKVEGLGRSTIEAVVKAGLVTSPGHLYALTLPVLSSVGVGQGKFGQVRAKAVLAQLSNRSFDLTTLLSGIAIPGLGPDRIKQIRRQCEGEFDTVSDWNPDKLRAFAVQAGIPSYVNVLVAGLDRARTDLDVLLSCVQIKPDTIAKIGTGPGFAITGSHPIPRKEIEAMITAAGGRVCSSVTGETRYLVIADVNSTSSKAKAARKLGCTLIEFDDLHDVLDQVRATK